MKDDWQLRDAVNKTGGPIYMVYELEDSDPPKNWLHNGVSHECSHVWQLKFRDVLRPFKTRCGISVATYLEAKSAALYNLVPVMTNCLWCVTGLKRSSDG